MVEQDLPSIIWLVAQSEQNFTPVIVPEGKAYKELSAESRYPTLGKDMTLPQHRPQVPHLLKTCPEFAPTQHQYPVWYFFYGTLGSVSKLRSLLSLPEDPTPALHEATTTGGTLETWGDGKYFALVDGPQTNRIEGLAYGVMSEDHEDALRKYETAAYEVVRCRIEMRGRVVQGCIFRFVGKID
jgi:hypothetical protein